MKHLFFLLGIAVCMPAGAAINDTGKIFADRPNFLQYNLTNETRLYTVDHDRDLNICQFAILDGEFNEISKFSTPSYPEVTAEYTRAQALDGPLNITFTYNDHQSPVSSKETFAQDMGNSYNCSILEEHGDETWYLPVGEWQYYYYDIFGKQYPARVGIWNNTTNSGVLREYHYSSDSWGFTGLYSDPEIRQDSCTPFPEWIHLKDATCADIETMVISQTMFNNDANFEWIVPIFEAVDVSYTTEWEKVEGKKVYCTGFRVDSQDGSVVATVKFPSGFYSYDYSEIDADIYIINDKRYLVVSLTNLAYEERYYIVYEIDANNSSIKAIDAPRRVSVAPTMPHRGTEVNITLGSPSDTVCKVIVTSVSGQTVMTRNIEPGKTSTTIDTGRFEKGVYIVTVSDGKTTRENTKIVVR